MKKLICALTAFLSPALSQAEVFEWSTNNVQILHGWNYELGRDDRTMITLEHASGWKYGDNFMFLDAEETFGDDPVNYSEISPRLSAGKILGKDFSNGYIKDYLLATTVEVGENTRVYLAGPAVDLNIPGFDWFQLNTYWRNDTNASGSTFQITPAWESNFDYMDQRWQFMGFADYSGAEGDVRSIFHISPMLLLDVGHNWGQDGKLFFGVEYEHWRNKFGVKDADEDNAQVMLKWVFN